MADIFISYSSADRDTARTFAGVFAARGHSVWWDRTIPPGRVFDDVIQEALNEAKCVIVLWSATSTRSNWVKTEASEAANRLLPVLIEDVSQPIGFKRIQAANLTGWSGDTDHPEFQNLIASVERLLAQPRAAAPPPLPEVARRPHPPVPVPASASRPIPWKTIAGAAALLLVAVVTMLYVRGGSDSESAANADAADAQPVAAVTPPASSASPPGSAASGDRINLLLAENGGELLTASDGSWAQTVDGDEGTYVYVTAGSIRDSEATFSFKDGRAATVDTITALIPSRSTGHVRQFELLAGDDGPLGPFRSIGVFTTENTLMVKTPYQAFTFPPVTAKFVKIRPLSTHGGVNYSMSMYEWQLFGKLN